MDLIYLNSNISQTGLNALAFETTKQLSKDCIAIITRSDTVIKDMITEAITIVGRAGAGVDNIDINRCNDLFIPVVNAPGLNSYSVAENAFGQMICAFHGIFEVTQAVRQLAANDLAAGGKKIKKRSMGNDARGKTIFIVGVKGFIGSKLAELCLNLKMRVIGFDPAKQEAPFGVEVVTDFNRLNEADVVSIHIPSNEATKGYINADLINKMQDNVILMNFARGDLVVSQDIYNAIQDNKIKCYLNDFPATQLYQHANIISSPHQAANTKEAQDETALDLCQTVNYYLLTGCLTNSVNFPTVDIGNIPNNCKRIAVTCEDRNDLLADINKAISQVGGNIVCQQYHYHSTTKIGYALLDVEGGNNEYKGLLEINSVKRIKTFG